MSEITLAQIKVLYDFKIETSEVKANKEMHCRRKQLQMCMNLTGDPHTFTQSRCVYRPRYSRVSFYVHAMTF